MEKKKVKRKQYDESSYRSRIIRQLLGYEGYYFVRLIEIEIEI